MSKVIKKILIFGYFGFGNLGDELILLSLIKNLKQMGNFSISVLSANPLKTSEEFKVKAIKRNNVFSVIKEIFNNDILLGAGGLLQDKTSKKSILYYLGLIFLGKLFGKKVILFSQGIGPINFFLNRWLAKKVLNKVDLITLRDRGSFSELKKIGVGIKLIVTGDAVYGLNFPKYKRRLHSHFRVGIVLRQFKNYKFFVKEIQEVYSELVKFRRVEFIFFSFHLSKDGVFEGRTIVKSDIKELIPKIASLDMIVGARYHSLVLASIFNIPFIGINCDEKIRNFCDFFKVECLNLRKNDFKKRLKSSIIKYMNKKVRYDITEVKRKVKESFKLIKGEVM